MTNTENTALQMIAEAARCPDYGPDMVKALMKKLDMNEKGFALLMNVAPCSMLRRALSLSKYRGLSARKGTA